MAKKLETINKSNTTEIKVSLYQDIQFKEEGEEFYSEGFVATTHPDRAKTSEYTGDILTREAVHSIVEQINDRTGMMADLASYRHDWVKEDNRSLTPAGRAVTAEVRELEDGHVGAFVKTHHNKSHKDFDSHKYEVENKYIPGYSIEFIAKKTRPISLGPDKYRMIDSLDMKGYGLANGRLIANPKAEITGFGYKEIIDAQNYNEGENKMVEEDIKNETPVADEVKEPKADEPKEPKVEEPTEEKTEVDAKEYAEYKEFLEMKEKKTRQDEITNAVKIALKEILPENRIQMKEQTEFKEIQESVEFKEWSKIQTKEVSVKEAFNRATAYAEKINAFDKLDRKYANSRRGYEIKCGGLLGEKIEIKALETDTNKSSDTDYLQSAAELSDIYAPAISKMLNQRTTFWGIIAKEDWSGRESITWRAENVANASGGFYFEGGAITKGNTTRQKLREEFKYHSIGVQVTGQMIESARSGIGDAFQNEVEAATRKKLDLMNTALFAEKGAFTDEEFLGLEYIGDSTGNTTLYGLTRSTTNLLGVSGSEFAAQGSVPLTKSTLRTGLRTLKDNGADMENVIIMSRQIQIDLFTAGNVDDAQRFNGTTPRVGFEGKLHFDGYPWFDDKAMNTDDVFIVNLGMNGVALAIQKPVTYEDLAKSDDSRSGFLKFYGNLYAKAPKQSVYMIQGAATS